MGTIVTTCPEGHVTTSKCRCMNKHVERRQSYVCSTRCSKEFPVEQTDDKPDLIRFIEDTEKRLFRTNQDTGANTNALLVWNRLREYAGLSRLTHDDLRQRHVDSSDNVQSVEELERFEKWYDDYSVLRDFDRMKRRYDALMEAGGMEGLNKRLRAKN